MKILFIKEQRSPSGFEGVGIYLLNVCIELNKLSVPYLLLYNKKDELYKEMINNAVNVRIIDLPPGSSKNIISRRSRLKKTRSLVSEIVLKENITHINVHFPHLLNYIGSEINIPVTAHWHGAFVDNTHLKYFYLKDIFNFREIINNLYRKTVVFNFKRADFIVCSSNASKNTAIGRFGVPKAKVSINRYGIPEPNSGPYLNIRKKLGFSANDKIILSVGRETKSKGVEDFCKVAMEFKNDLTIKFVFLGGYSESVSYHNELVSKYGKYVTFLEARPDVYNYYNAADLFLFLSHREAAGLVLAEAMAFGLPLVTWNIIGVNEMYESRVQGIMINFENHTSVINNINSILKDKSLYDRFSNESKLKFYDYSILESTNNLLSIFSSQIKNSI